MKTINKILFLASLIISMIFISCHKESDNESRKKIQKSDAVIDHLVFEEICYSGTVFTKVGFEILYNEDNYIKIHNPSKKTIYLDGLLLARCVFSSDVAYDLEAQDTRQTHFPTTLIIQFPGTGSDYPIEPSESVILAAYAYNHREYVEGSFIGGATNSYDLSDIDFEWQTEEQIARDEDKPSRKDIPNMKMIHSQGEWNNQDSRQAFDIHTGRTSLALIKLETTIEDLMTKDEYKLPYQLTDTGENHYHVYQDGVAVNIPNEWVIDCVCLCPLEDYYRPTVGDKLDSGWTSVKHHGSHKEGRGMSVFRKHDGNTYVDLDNSTTDFETRVASKSQKNESE